MFSKQGRSKISSVLIFALLFSLLLPAFAWGATAVQLKDIANSYAQKEIQSLIDSGIISGYEDGTFQPTKAMSRAELAKIIVVSLGLKENPDKASVFTDVAANSWYRGFVGALVDSKITQGTSATTFSPDASVTREELVVFFIRAMGLETAAGKVAVDAKLTDLAQVSSWAQAHVSLAFKVGFVQGIENADKTLKFSPKDKSERQALARLAYEFKTNKSTFITKANELAGISLVSSAKATTNTTVEVTFSQDVTAVAAADFTFDGGLTVSKAELKADTKNVVVLTTSLQNLNTIYKLSYKGKDTGITITGAGYAGGGGGGGGTYSNNTDKDEVKINRPVSYAALTLSESGTFGPPDGYGVAKVGTLTLNPGATGEITLQNIEADNIVVASGSENSIKLRNTIVIKLVVSTGTQVNPVRIESLSGATITTTILESQGVIEATYGGFGTINIGAGASGKNVELRGTITGAVYVTDQVTTAVKIKIGARKGGGATTVSNLNLGGHAAVTTDSGQTVTSVNITAPNITVSMGGTGVVASVNAAATATNSTIDLGADVNITKVNVYVSIVFTGDKAKIIAIVIVIHVTGVTVTSPSTGATPGSGSTSPTVASISSSPSSVSLTTYGAKQQLTISAIKTDNSSSDVTSSATYVSSNTAVATVDAGMVKAEGNGTATITVTYEGKTVTVMVTVNATPSVTSVTYVTYNTSATVTGSVYTGQTGENNVSGSAFHIPAANASDYLIIKFSDALSTDVSGVTLLTNSSATAATYSVVDSTYTYLAIKYPTARVSNTVYELKIDGLKKSSDNSAISTVTVYVYQD